MPATIDPINAIIVLGLLHNEPLNGYEMKQAVEEQLEGFVSITSGTIYYTIKKLAGRDWIRLNRKTNGKGPEGRVYEITRFGYKALKGLLEEVALEPPRFYSPFDVAVYFMPYLEPEMMITALERRIINLKENRSRLEQIESKNPGRWPYHLFYLHEKARESLDAHEKWCRRLKKKVESKSMEKVRHG